MPSLPIPAFAALVLSFLLIRLWQRGGPGRAFAPFLALVAMQAVLVVGVHHWGLGWMRAVQPVTAMLLPPAAWVSLRVTAMGAPLRGQWPHLAAPVAMALLLGIAPVSALGQVSPALALMLDLSIPALYLGYGLAVWRAARGDLPRLRLGAQSGAALIWRAIAGVLAASALSDLAISGVILIGQGGWVPWIIAVVTSGNLLLLGALTQMPELEAPPEPAAPAPTREDSALTARLEELMRQGRLWTDPDLTLTRLARRLHVPVKTLSSAINRDTGANVSRYVNGFRVAHACARLAAGDDVTQAMLTSGFATKSNFHREFRRVTGKSPTEWRADGAAALAPPAGSAYEGEAADEG